MSFIISQFELKAQVLRIACKRQLSASFHLTNQLRSFHGATPRRDSKSDNPRIRKPWTDEQLIGVHVLGLTIPGQVIGRSLLEMECRPPITFIVYNNGKLQNFARLEEQLRMDMIGKATTTVQGFNLEVMDPVPYEYDEEVFRSARWVRLKTLTMDDKHVVKSAVGPDNDSNEWLFPMNNRRLDHPVDFDGDPTDLKSPVDSTMQIQKSVLVPSVMDPTKFSVSDISEASAAQEDIKTLIVTIKPQHIKGVLKCLKHRLRKDSTILLIHRGMMIQEMLDEEVFPDPLTRPNYMSGTLTHSLSPDVKGRMKRDAAIKEMPDPLSALCETYVAELEATVGERDTKILKVWKGSVGNLSYSAVARVTGENDDQHAAREESAAYIIRLLLGARDLNARYIDSVQHTRDRYLKTVLASVVQSMGVLFNCVNGKIIENVPERRKVFDNLVHEAAEIMRMDFEWVTENYLRRYISEYITQTSDRYSAMATTVSRGNLTMVEWTNGFLVKRAWHHRLPLPEEHSRTWNRINDMTREASHRIQDLIDEKREAASKKRKEQEGEKYGFDRHVKEQRSEVRLASILRRREAQERKDDWGARARAKGRRVKVLKGSLMNKCYSTPKVEGLGNTSLKLTRKGMPSVASPQTETESSPEMIQKSKKWKPDQRVRQIIRNFRVQRALIEGPEPDLVKNNAMYRQLREAEKLIRGEIPVTAGSEEQTASPLEPHQHVYEKAKSMKTRRAVRNFWHEEQLEEAKTSKKQMREAAAWSPELTIRREIVKPFRKHEEAAKLFWERRALVEGPEPDLVKGDARIQKLRQRAKRRLLKDDKGTRKGDEPLT
ncbi:hypothetical protein VTL71DRAFT_16496 [Oculimacula yallundae]|uniref:Uncharacterized protein n=1 Tax=Oculimacula yallundae TaxID=86028 RepID=A0ABR4CEQ1_9HELO